jgi:TatD DNase family protein
MWTDTHCHLDDDRYRGDGDGDSRRELGGTNGVLDRAREAGVSRFINVGCDRDSSLRAIDIANANVDVWASVGLHPHEAVHGVDSIRDLFDSPRVVAVGEAGLDYYYDHSPRETQHVAFARQIELANDLDLPLIIHTRDAWDDTFSVLAEVGVPSSVVFHCFTGGPTEARRCLDIGARLSFSGIVTFKTAVDVAEAARICPLDRILVETDSPYLAPVPHRGRVNQPSNVAVVGTFIADMRSIAVDEFARITTRNARIAFPSLAS